MGCHTPRLKATLLKLPTFPNFHTKQNNVKKLHSHLFVTVNGTELENKAVKQFQINWLSNPV
jgi:hypothetical protein